MNLQHHLARTLLACALLQALTPVQAQAPADTEAAPRRGEPITLNFANADIETAARTMALVTGRDVVLDPRVKGTLSLTSDTALAPLAAFERFAAALRLQGYVVVEADGLYKIVPEAEGKQQAPGASAPRTGGNRIVTQIFRIAHEPAANLLPVLRPLISPNNTVNVTPGSNTLVITDYADNMQRLGRIIASLDQPAAAEVEVIELKHSVATDMAPLITRLLEGGNGGGPGNAGMGGMTGMTGLDTAGRTTLIAEPRSNTLILRAANPARVALVRSLVERLDHEPLDTGNGDAGNVYVVHLKNADAVRLATALRAAVAAGQTGNAQGAAGPQAGLAQSQQPQAQPANYGSQGSASPQASAPLNNANAVSTGGQIQADPASNSLVITASPPQYRQLRAVIDKLDGRRAQVFIEALVVEVRADKAASFGVQWQSLLGRDGGGGVSSTVLGLDSSIVKLAAAVVGQNYAALAAGAPKGLNIVGSGKFLKGYGLSTLINAFASDTDSNVLSTPSLQTIDNEEARILVGYNVPFPTGSYASSATGGANAFNTVERKDVGVMLKVRPQINENGTIKLNVAQESSEVALSNTVSNYGPTTNKREIESTVVAEDGNIVLIGGLLSDSYSDSADKVPVAGDIPLLGNLFRSEHRERRKRNLMIFLRPVVMRDAASTEAFAAGRYDEIRSAQQAMQPDAGNVMLRKVDAAPVLPAPALPLHRD